MFFSLHTHINVNLNNVKIVLFRYFLILNSTKMGSCDGVLIKHVFNHCSNGVKGFVFVIVTIVSR